MIEKNYSSQHELKLKLMVKKSLKEYPISLDNNCNECKIPLKYKCKHISDLIESEAYLCHKCLKVYSTPFL